MFYPFPWTFTCDAHGLVTSSALTCAKTTAWLADQTLQGTVMTTRCSERGPLPGHHLQKFSVGLRSRRFCSFLEWRSRDFILNSSYWILAGHISTDEQNWDRQAPGMRRVLWLTASRDRPQGARHLLRRRLKSCFTLRCSTRAYQLFFFNKILLKAFSKFSHQTRKQF